VDVVEVHDAIGGDAVVSLGQFQLGHETSSCPSERDHDHSTGPVGDGVASQH